MLVIRMQRTGRKGHAMFRVVVQDSRRTPTSGKIVAQLGSYDPHAKSVIINKEKAQFYLDHGAQPSGRVTLLLKQEGVKLPEWVQKADKKAGKLRNPDKLRRNRPPEEKVEEAPVEAPAEEVTSEAEAPAVEEAIETPAETAPEAEAPDAAAETTAEEVAETETSEVEAPAETPADAETTETPAAEEAVEDDKKAA